MDNDFKARVAAVTVVLEPKLALVNPTRTAILVQALRGRTAVEQALKPLSLRVEWDPTGPFGDVHSA